MNQEKIGNLIREIRKKNNLTQKEFADKYGITYQAVSKWENGKNIPDISLLKEISKDFNIDINDILEGEYKKKKNKKIYVIVVILILIVFTFFLINKEGNFSFKTLSSTCTDFNIKGSIAYNNKKSSIYISDIDYCGNMEDDEYRKIDCILYENNEGKETEISKYTYDKDESIKLDNFLKTLNFKIDDYKQTCKKYTKNSLYLKIKAIGVNGKNRTYKIPLSLNDNC